MRLAFRGKFLAWPLFWAWMAIIMPVSADWVNPPKEELYEQSQIVVVGKFIGRDVVRSVGREGELVVGTISVESVLKGDEWRTIVVMELPPLSCFRVATAGENQIRLALDKLIT
jgi:hypothetical protein